MFSFLSPVTLWFAALLAIPLAIHFLGRERLKKIPFPSLLLVRGGLARSMARHRIKNWLLLVLRTLLLLCLLLALWNPVLKRPGMFPDAGTRVMALFHNGIYAGIPLDDGMLIGEHQRKRLSYLDSLARDFRVDAVLTATGGTFDWKSRNSPEERFGDYAGAVGALLHDIPAATPSQVHLPVFDYSEWVRALPHLIRALHDNPALRVALIDYTPVAHRAGAFRTAEIDPPGESPLLALRMELSGTAYFSESKARMQIHQDGKLLRETPVLDRRPVINLELPENRRLTGTLRLEGGPVHAAPEYHFSVPNPGRLNLGHAGATLSSLPSLGGNNFFKHVVHSPQAETLVEEAMEQNFRLLFLANASLSAPSIYQRLRNYVQDGGLLILSLGAQSDIGLLNRHLLQPLEAGRVGEIIDAGGPIATHLAHDTETASIPSRLPAHTYLNRLFSFSPGPDTRTLLSADNGYPVLVSRSFGTGKMLLWLTDLDDLGWTNLGINPVTPLLHHHFHSSHWSDAWKNFSVSSDSTLELELGPEYFPPRVTDPEGRPFDRVASGQGTLRIGPFPRLGFYSIAGATDTLRLAVNVFSSGSSSTPFDWDTALEPLADYREKIRVIPFADSMEALVDSYYPLWKILILAAISLLFAEGMVSIFLGMRTKTVRQ